MSVLRLLLLISTLFLSLSASGSILYGFVSLVYDGDTITVQTDAGAKRVRLAGIDAPEMKQPFGTESRDALSQLVLNQPITAVTIKQDRYGRAVGKVLLNQEDINLRQVSAGLAWVYTEYINELSQEDQVLYRAAEKAANDARIGLWSDLEPVAPWNYRRSK